MIGVCIKYFHENYGGMLQAYATVAMLEAKGLDYELIRYQKKRSLTSMIRSLPRLFNGVLINDKYEAFLKMKGMKFHPDFARNNNIRMKAFKKFNNEHFIKLSPVFTGYNNLCEGAKRYNAIITGSDQLWSPAGLSTNFYNLMFVPHDIRKISYASSFGVRDIPWYQRKRTAQFLKRIEYISMRENQGSEIVKKLIGRDVPTILDPVFMFDENDWEKLIPRKIEINEPYIFAYFLGSNPIHRETVKNVSKQLNCKIIALRHLDQYVEADEQFGDFAPYDVSPDRFLNLLRGASYVCTDSFHGACFSIINRKKFIVFNRYQDNSKYSKNSRIDTLCINLGLQSRRYKDDKLFYNQLIAPIDYNSVEERLSNLRKISFSYLNQALKGIT